MDEDLEISSIPYFESLIAGTAFVSWHHNKSIIKASITLSLDNLPLLLALGGFDLFCHASASSGSFTPVRGHILFNGLVTKFSSNPKLNNSDFFVLFLCTSSTIPWGHLAGWQLSYFNMTIWPFYIWRNPFLFSGWISIYLNY